MTITEALDIVVGRTGVERYRQLCDPEHPDYREEYVDWIMSQAQQPAENFPPMRQQIASAAKAVVNWVTSGAPIRTKAEQESLLTICRGCEHFAADLQRCRQCGCAMPLKVRLDTEHCPLGKW